VSTLSQRTQSLASRLPSDRGRERQEVSLVMTDGTEVHGMLHRAQGSRTLDFLNRQSEGFVAMTHVTLYRGEETEMLPFIAINKSHIIRVIEADDLD
jgi:hypothetical protein